jgi:hypothetical protein
MLDIYSLVRQIKLLSILMVYRIKIYPMHSSRKKLLVYCIQGVQRDIVYLCLPKGQV